MTTVYLLMKHPRLGWDQRGYWMKAGEVVKASTNRAELKAIADEKNARRPNYFWKVRTVKVSG